MNMTKQKPIFQPLVMIQTVLMIIKGMLESSEEQLINMKKVRVGTLNNELINRSLKLYNGQNEDIEVFCSNVGSGETLIQQKNNC